MRELMRSIAHANMKRLGFARVNKKRGRTESNPKGKSFFAENWRDFVKFVPEKGKKKKRGFAGKKRFANG